MSGYIPIPRGYISVPHGYIPVPRGHIPVPHGYISEPYENPFWDKSNGGWGKKRERRNKEEENFHSRLASGSAQTRERGQGPHQWDRIFLSFSRHYCSSRMGCCRVLRFYMGSWVKQILGFQPKQIWAGILKNCPRVPKPWIWLLRG